MITPLMGRLSNSGSGLQTGTTGNQWLPGWGGTDLIPSVAALGGTAGLRRCIVPCDGVISNLRVSVDTAGGSSRIWTLVVTKNAVDTALTCTVTDPATIGNDTAHSFNVVAGDLIEVRVVASNSGINATNVTWGMQFSGANFKECITGSASHQQGPATGATNYIGLWNATSGQAVADFQWGASRDVTHENISPLGGTITGLYIKLITAPGAAKSWAFTIYKNGSAEASSTVTIAGAGVTTGSVTGLSIAVAAGDTLSLEAVPTGTPTGSGGLCWGTAFTSTTDGESPLCGSVRNNGFTASNNQPLVPMGNHNFANTEARYQDVAPVAFTLRALRFEVTAAPGSGKTFDVISRNAGSNGNLTLSLTNAATTGSDLTHNDSIALGALFNFLLTTTGTPTGTSMRWAAVAFVAPSSTNFTTFGVITREHDIAKNAPTTTYYFEATLKSTGGYAAYARLYNITDGGAVSGAEVNTSSLTAARVRSSSFTLPSGSKEYRAEFGGPPSSGTYTCYAADIIADVAP